MARLIEEFTTNTRESYWKNWSMSRKTRNVPLNNYLSAAVFVLATVVVVIHPVA